MQTKSIDSLLKDEISNEEQRLLELAADLEARGLTAESHHAYWDVLAINPRNGPAQAALRRLKGEVTVTGLVPAPVSESQVEEMKEKPALILLAQSESARPSPSRPPPIRAESRTPSMRSQSRLPRPVVERTASKVEPAPTKRAQPGVIAELTDDLVAPDPRASAVARVALVVLMLALAGVLVLVWDTRRELTSLSIELRATRGAAEAATQDDRARPISLTFGPATSIDYEAPVDGIVTAQAEPGQLLSPGDLVAEIMDARDHRRLVKARAKHRWLRRKARQSPALALRADRARGEALKLLTRAKRTQVRAAQRGIARPIADVHAVKAGAVVMRLDDPSTLSADLPAMERLGPNTTCRVAGDAPSEQCRLLFERSAENERVRVLVSNEEGRFLPGQTIELMMEASGE